MKIGHPFKARWGGRPALGMLAVPDILKYKIPVPFAFVPINPEKDGRAMAQNKQHSSVGQKKEQPKLLSSAAYAFTKECQKIVQNYNNCIKNNNSDTCSYYSNYLRLHCQAK
jgi:hypothetical protein